MWIFRCNSERERERKREREREKREKRERERWREIESTEGSIINQHFFRNRIKFLFQKPTKKLQRVFFFCASDGFTQK